MFSKKSWQLLALIVLTAFVLGPLQWWHQVRSANMTEVAVRLSTPRLSFRGELDGTNSVGSSLINLETNPANVAANVTSTSSANLFEGDTVLIGAHQYQVASVSGSGSFTVTNLPSTTIDVLLTGDADDGDEVIASRSADLEVGFNTVSAITDGSFRVLVPAATANFNDSIPDPDGWDYGTTVDDNVSITCPNDVVGEYSFGSSTPEAGSVVRDGITYHSFVCSYTGSGGNNTDFTLDSNPMTISGLINPSPASDHSEGFADTYKIIVEHLDTSDNVVDATVVDVAVIESVRVTASVPPQITFRILGLASGANYCGVTTSVETTSTLVPMGELLIDSFKYAAQELVVSTNADNGYTVTAIADNQLHRVGETCVGDADESTGGCIQDAEGDTPAMSHTTADVWTSPATKGFGFSLQDNTVGPADLDFSHDSSAGNCTGANGNCWRQFADEEDGQTPQSIFTSASVADGDSAYVCYKAIVSATQQAGSDYSTAVTYRATATF